MYLPLQKGNDTLESSRVLNEEQVPTLEQFELSIGNLALHRFLVADLRDAVIATATDVNWHPETNGMAALLFPTDSYMPKNCAALSPKILLIETSGNRASALRAFSTGRTNPSAWG